MNFLGDTPRPNPQPPISLRHYGVWQVPVTIQRNNFKYKSLSCWALNYCLGCPFGCRFCYVPDASTRKLSAPLASLGVEDPDAEWGTYAFLRPWNERRFLGSLRDAEDAPLDQLNPDGNRAVMLSTTTDPLFVFAGPDAAKNKEQNAASRQMLVKSLELIRDKSTINVRVLTRSPLARNYFDLLKTFGNRLLFGMSLPTLNNGLARIYEPKAPAPSQRLAALQAAKAAGLHVFVAMAPTYPECDEADVIATLRGIKALDPITVFHEPINIRAENVARIAAHAKSIGQTVRTEVFVTPITWRRYAIESLIMVQRLAQETGLINRLHLWPDPDLGSKARFMDLRREGWQTNSLTKYQIKQHKTNDEIAYTKYRTWLTVWWSRISEWPAK